MTRSRVFGAAGFAALLAALAGGPALAAVPGLGGSATGGGIVGGLPPIPAPITAPAPVAPVVAPAPPIAAPVPPIAAPAAPIAAPVLPVPAPALPAPNPVAAVPSVPSPSGAIGAAASVGGALPSPGSAVGAVGGALPSPGSAVGAVGGALPSPGSAVGAVGGALPGVLPSVPAPSEVIGAATGAVGAAVPGGLPSVPAPAEIIGGAAGAAGSAVSGATGQASQLVNGALGAPGTVTVAPLASGVGRTISATGLGVGLGGGTLQDVLGVANAPNALGAALQAVNDVGRPPNPAVFDVDLQGNRIVRNEVLALSPSPQALALAQTLNFTVLQDNPVGALGRLIVLGVPAGLSTTDAVAALRRGDPVGAYELNHIYDPSGEAPTLIPVSVRRGEATSLPAQRGEIAIGLVDAGVDRSHGDLRRANIVSANFAGPGESPPSAHGTAIASLMVGSGTVSGVLPGATLYVGDAYGGQSDGGGADAVIRSLVWVAEKGATVINVSLVGPPNALLETAVKALTAKGHVIVAAVGNDGPAMPVNYPAAYPNVVAVTSVDQQMKVQVDANRGPQIAFATYGVDVRVAQPNNSYGRATGTSFAAPLIAARIAAAMSRPDARLAGQIKQSLQAEAVDLGARGRDPVFGYGFVESTPRTTTASSN